jgi:enterobacterial common antigen flippase
MTEERKNYSRIVKSSSIIGGAQGVNMLIGMIRVKFVAILIGPIGVGLVATYQSLIQLIGTIAGLGLQSSAVRDIAQAVSRGEEEQTARIVLSLRRMCWLTGALGSLSVMLLSPLLSQITFNSPDYTVDISLVGLTIFLGNLKGGQMALIQGNRRISDLAKLNIIGAISGSVISVLLYWQYGLDGIVPALVCLGITELMASWWFARKITITNVTMSWKESFGEAGGMARMGLAFMWNGLLIAVLAYLTRLIITQEIDLMAVGIFSAAFALSGMVVNFILGAMGADYYPSLTAISNDHKEMRVLVNQQTEIGLLLAIPPLVATLAFSPWIIKIFYTSDFSQSADLLRWFAVGCMGRVISWPMGFIILAKGLSKLFVVTESLINIVHLGLIIIMLRWFGIEGVAMAFPILYGIYILMILGVSRYLIDFKWSAEVLKILLILSIVTGIIFTVSLTVSLWVSTLIGAVFTVVLGVYCLQELSIRLGSEHKVSRIVEKFIRIPVKK